MTRLFALPFEIANGQDTRKNHEMKNCEMLIRITKWFEPPVFPDDEEKTKLAHTINLLGWYYALALCITAFVFIPFFALRKLESSAIVLTLGILYGIARYILFQGQLKYAVTLLIASAWGVFSLIAVLSGGIYSPLLFNIIATTIVVNLLLESNIGLVFLIASILLVSGLAALQQNEYALPDFFVFPPATTWLFFTLALLFMYAVMRLTVRSLREALAYGREREKRFRALIENSADAIALIDHQGTALYHSPSYSRIMGYSREERYRKNTFDLIHPDDRESLARLFASILEQPACITIPPTRVQHGDGTWRWVEGVANNLLAEPAVHAIVINFRDITQRKQAEEQLRQSEERYRTLVETANDAILLTDLQGKHLFRNSAYYSSLGFQPGELVDENGWTRVHPDDLTTVRALFTELNQQGEVGGEYRVQHREGHWLYRYNKAKVLRDATGQPYAILSIIRDLTERKRNEDAIQQRNAELTALYQIGQALSKLAESSEILELVSIQISHLLDNRNLYIALYDRAANFISFPIYTMNGKRFNVKGRTLGNGITDYIIRTQVPFFVRHDLVGELARRGITLIGDVSCSFLGVPMRAGDQVIGVIALQDYEHENTYNEHHLELLTTIAAQLTIAIENARLYAQVQKLAVTDTLTGSFNRTFFEAELVRIERGRDFPVSIVVADLDNMKLTNDRLGHAIGDELLKHATQVLQATFRADDIIARIGGDEFAILLPRTDRATVEEMLARVQSKLTEHNTIHPALPIQLSIGAATAGKDELLSQAFIFADQRMYADKTARKSKEPKPTC